MRLRLAPARRHDVRALARILAGWTAETDWMPEPQNPDENRRLLDRLIRESEVVTVRTWRGPRGFLARDDDHIHALFLAPDARGRGVGSRLLDLAKTRSKRLELWTYQANHPARRFYAREGFREVERTDGACNDEGLPDVRLIWTREEKR